MVWCIIVTLCVLFVVGSLCMGSVSSVGDTILEGARMVGVYILFALAFLWVIATLVLCSAGAVYLVAWLLGVL